MRTVLGGILPTPFALRLDEDEGLSSFEMNNTYLQHRNECIVLKYRRLGTQLLYS
jgi:hypothetical protein